MAIEDFGGEVLGQKIEIVTADHQNKPDLATAIARRWYDTEKRRHDHRADDLVGRARGAGALQGKEEDRHRRRALRPRASPAMPARPTASTGPTTPARSRSAPAARWCKAGGDTWFFLTADYAFGYALEKDTSDIVTANGGKVLGSVRLPSNSVGLLLLPAAGAELEGAKIVGLANAGLDTTNSIKQASEFGIVQGGQKLAALLLTLAEVHGLGLQAAQGLVLTEGFYWDLNDAHARIRRALLQAHRPDAEHDPGRHLFGDHCSYLKAVKAAGTDGPNAVAKKLHELPVDDVFAASGKVLENGRMVHDMYLFEVKKPSESKKPWDYYKQLAVVPGDKAFFAAKDSGCPLTK